MGLHREATVSFRDDSTTGLMCVMRPWEKAPVGFPREREQAGRLWGFSVRFALTSLHDVILCPGRVLDMNHRSCAGSGQGVDVGVSL